MVRSATPARRPLHSIGALLLVTLLSVNVHFALGATENGTCSASPSTATSGSCPASSTETGQHEEFSSFSQDSSRAQYIVRFKRYAMPEAHRSTVVQALGPEGSSWQWIARNNPAYKHPTDFGLVWLDEPETDQLKQKLAHLESVIDIHLDKKIKLDLKSSEDTNSNTGTEQAGPEWESSKEEEEEEEEASSVFRAEKGPGRMSTRSTWDLEENKNHDVELRRSRRLMNRGASITALLGADQLWAQGFSGKGVRVGVFDTGISKNHPHIRNIKDRSNWTHQNSLSDGLGHGTFVAGVIGGQDGACPGLAPDVLLHTFKVFTDDQVSYTSWFMDAFNYAMISKVNVINLSIGGPDYLDMPFVDKVLEVTSNGILMVSAIGNDGPLYGTLNNPADQNDVIGVGGIDWWDNIAGFSSRGMTTWELPLGYGRSKPDVMAYSRDVQGSRIEGGCKSLSGTSVASPVVAGAVCLLASTLPEETRWKLLNPASMKQALVEGAVRVPKLNLYEQGAGRINVLNSMKVLAEYKPRASVVPAALDLTDCPYFWPFCRQPLYAGAQPLMFNATVLNGMHVTGEFEGTPTFTPTDEGGKHLRVYFEHSSVLWPWSGYLALFITVAPEAKEFKGVATGVVKFTIVSPGAEGKLTSTLEMPVKINVIPTPPRSKRVLWDQFHNLKYPPAYIPRDNLEVKSDILDWHGDHLHTNFHDMYNHLRDRGYYVEVLGSPYTCFDASNYGALLVVDAEEEYYPEEITKLADDVSKGLSLVVFGEWYNAKHMGGMKFFDDNTRSWWTPVVGGSNVPALNDLLKPYGMALGDAVISGWFDLAGQRVQINSGANVLKVPKGGWLHRAQLSNAAGGLGRGGGGFGVFGVAKHGQGYVTVMGDSNCLDSSHQASNCYDFLVNVLETVTEGKQAGLNREEHTLPSAFVEESPMPERRSDVNFTAHSFILQNPLRCYSNSGCNQPGAAGCGANTAPTEPAVQPSSTPTPATPEQKPQQPEQKPEQPEQKPEQPEAQKPEQPETQTPKPDPQPAPATPSETPAATPAEGQQPSEATQPEGTPQVIHGTVTAGETPSEGTQPTQPTTGGTPAKEPQEQDQPAATPQPAEQPQQQTQGSQPSEGNTKGGEGETQQPAETPKPAEGQQDGSAGKAGTGEDTPTQSEEQEGSKETPAQVKAPAAQQATPAKSAVTDVGAEVIEDPPVVESVQDKKGGEERRAGLYTAAFAARWIAVGGVVVVILLWRYAVRKRGSPTSSPSGRSRGVFD